MDLLVVIKALSFVVAVAIGAYYLFVLAWLAINGDSIPGFRSFSSRRRAILVTLLECAAGFIVALLLFVFAVGGN